MIGRKFSNIIEISLSGNDWSEVRDGSSPLYQNGLASLITTKLNEKPRSYNVFCSYEVFVFYFNFCVFFKIPSKSQVIFIFMNQKLK